MEAETSHVACRDALETLFMDAIELLEISISDNTMREVLSLKQLNHWFLVIPNEADFARFAAKIARISTGIKQVKQTLLA